MNADSTKVRGRFSQRAFWISMLLATGCEAQSLMPYGCPVFHCTIEATSVTAQPLITTVSTVTSNSSLGVLPKQGCSGNGTVLTCLFATDNATGAARGTLKVLDATTLQPIWGSAAAGSYNLNAPSSSDGQVPVNFGNGTIGAGDSKFAVRYSSEGAVIRKLALNNSALNFGLTPISNAYAIDSQENGVLTLVDLATWSSAGALTLLDPMTSEPLQLVSPSSGATNVLYAVAENPTSGDGYLFAVRINSSTKKLQVSSYFPFTGQSGASPVVVTPSMLPSLSSNLILLHVPGLPDQPPQNQLLGLSDAAAGLQQVWSVPLTAPLVVAPTVDVSSNSLFYHQNYSPIIYQNDLSSGALVKSFNVQRLAGVTTLSLNAHLAAIEYGSAFTLLVGGSYVTSAGTGTEAVMAFQPSVSPQALMWSVPISGPANYLAAWNFASSSETGIVCPIAIADYLTGDSAIVRLCDF